MFHFMTRSDAIFTALKTHRQWWTYFNIQSVPVSDNFVSLQFSQQPVCRVDLLFKHVLLASEDVLKRRHILKKLKKQTKI